MSKALDWLVYTNNCLEKIPDCVNSYLSGLIKSGQNVTQGYVDKVCTWLAWWVNISVERLRQKVIETLKEQYASNSILVRWAMIIQDVMKDPWKAIGDFFGLFSTPVKAAIDFTQTLLIEVPRLAANLAKIASSLPPEIPQNTNINFNAFKLKVGTISMKEIVSGGVMPTPEEMFPEPESPFGKSAFEDSFNNAKKTTFQDNIKYHLNNGTSTSAISEAIKDLINNN